MILESIVTSVDTAGRVNLAPMGPKIISGSPSSANSEICFSLRPFLESRTYENLCQTRKAVIHVTDDSLLFARAAVNALTDQEVIDRVEQLGESAWWPLKDCHHWFAVEVESIRDDGLRAEMPCRVVDSRVVRPFFGFHRARHAVLEAAILATRTHLIPASQIEEQIMRLQPLVDKTAGPSEHEAFDFLKAMIDERLASDQ